MNEKKEKKKSRPVIRIARGFSTLAIIGAVISMLVSGFSVVAMLVLFAASSVVIGPPIAEGGGIGEVLIGIFEAIVEGIAGVLEAIATAISSISP